MATTLLDIDALVCGYGDGVVLEDLSLRIAKGERVGVLGRNGVGKTTLLKTIIGLIPPRSGRISLRDKTITNLPAHTVAQAGIGYVPQGREIFADFTVEENLQLGNLAASHFNREYGLFPVLQQRAHSRAGALSGGQQQQLAIARAMVAAPQLLLLDEPSEGVQPSIVHEIGDTLVSVAAQSGLAVLLVEQNIDLVLQVCQRCVFLDEGRVVASFSVSELAETPKIFEKFMGV